VCEHCHGHIQLARIEQRDPPGDHTLLFHLLNAAPASGTTQTNLLGNVSQRAGAVGLKYLQDCHIELVHGA
jgi:hypothetical protein